MATYKFQIGDVVDCGGIWQMRGVVLGTSRDWWIINGHYDVSNCIVNAKEMKLVERGTLNPYVISILRARGVPFNELKAFNKRRGKP